jgi:hypothetical protein
MAKQKILITFAMRLLACMVPKFCSHSIRFSKGRMPLPIACYVHALIYLPEYSPKNSYLIEYVTMAWLLNVSTTLCEQKKVVEHIHETLKPSLMFVGKTRNLL